ncbi:MAG: TaqI-like C-terminal specificity domain-containing protein [Minisyncoccia bacterium]
MKFDQKYNPDAFSAFLQDFLPEDYVEKEKDIADLSRCKIITKARELGHAPSLNTYVLEMTHAKETDPRVSIATDAFKILATFGYDKALVIFKNNESENYRLSYLTISLDLNEKNKIVAKYSNARRYSFYLGVGAKTKTPEQQLVKHGRVKDTDDLLSRFSLEVVSKEFYTRIAEQYSKLVGGVRGEGRRAVSFQRTLALGAQSDDVYANFAIRLIGRLVFCWFLKQKKSNEGIPLIPSDLLSVDAVTRTGDYYHSLCVPLFFEVLNKPHNSRPSFFRHSDLFEMVPFLNGGLFQDHAEDNHKFNRTTGMSDRRGSVVVPDEWFAGLFGIFEEYNFTIDENTSIDTELSIDPEMLGRIFENLLAEVNPETGDSARSATGSFYTPREIVDFMVEEAIVSHLVTKTGFSEEKIRALSTYDVEDDLQYPIPENERRTIVEAIHGTAVLDPACGSGAFPIGVLQHLVRMLGILDPDCSIYLSKLPVEVRRQLQEHNLPYVRKLGVIRECIHGVDIQPVATDISRLRCFLTLVVDQRVDDSAPNRGIDPLPNLDFKFVCADTLTKPPVHEGPLFGDTFAVELGELIDEYFAPVDQLHKLEVGRKLQQLITDRTKKELESILRSFSVVKDEKHRKLLAEKNEDEHEERLRINNLWGSYENIFTNKPVGFFDTRYFFPAVERKGGFDIVIANPPYISIEKFARTVKQAEWRKSYKTFAARGDIYCLFYERGLNLLRTGGVLSFISSNKFQRAGYGRNLRQLLSSYRIHDLIDFCELPVFEASTDPMIVVVEKSKAQEADEITALVVKNESDIAWLRQVITKQKSIYSPSQLKEEGWSLEGSSGLELIEKLKSVGTPLEDYVKDRFYYGIKTGLNEAFVIDGDTRQKLVCEDSKSAELIKPWIRGRDIKRWTHEYHQFYVIIVPFGFNTELAKYPAVLNHLNRFEDLLKARGQCKTSRRGGGEGQHHWLELDNNPSKSYIAAFNEPKIVFNETSKRLHAYLDTEGNAINKTGFIILTPDALYVLAILNSTVMDWFYRSTFPSWGDPWSAGRVQFRGDRMAKVPIPTANPADKGRLTDLADRATKAAAAGDMGAVTQIEHEIDEIVYKLFDLNEKEIAQIEFSLTNTRESELKKSGVNFY